MDAFEDTQTGHMVGEEFLCAFVERYLAVICHHYRAQSIWLKLGASQREEEQKPYKSLRPIRLFVRSEERRVGKECRL